MGIRGLWKTLQCKQVSFGRDPIASDVVAVDGNALTCAPGAHSMAARDALPRRHRFACIYSVVPTVLDQNLAPLAEAIGRWLRKLRRRCRRVMVIFDGATSPDKAAERAARRRGKADRLREAIEKRYTLEARELSDLCKAALDITTRFTLSLQRLLAVQFEEGSGVSFRHAPYEADPQLVALRRGGDATLIMSPDGDFVAHGERRLLLKVERDHAKMWCRDDGWKNSGHGTWEPRYRLIAYIGAGCDYLDNVRGIGAARSLEAMRAVIDEGLVSRDDGLETVVDVWVQKLKSLNRSVKVPQDYEAQVVDAYLAFRCATVAFDDELKLLEPLPEGLSAEALARFEGRRPRAMSADVLSGVAAGTIDPETQRPFEPLTPRRPSPTPRRWASRTQDGDEGFARLCVRAPAPFTGVRDKATLYKWLVEEAGFTHLPSNLSKPILLDLVSRVLELLESFPYMFGDLRLFLDEHDDTTDDTPQNLVALEPEAWVPIEQARDVLVAHPPITDEAKERLWPRDSVGKRIAAHFNAGHVSKVRVAKVRNSGHPVLAVQALVRASAPKTTTIKDKFKRTHKQTIDSYEVLLYLDENGMLGSPHSCCGCYIGKWGGELAKEQIDAIEENALHPFLSVCAHVGSVFTYLGMAQFFANRAAPEDEVPWYTYLPAPTEKRDTGQATLEVHRAMPRRQRQRRQSQGGADRPPGYTRDTPTYLDSVPAPAERLEGVINRLTINQDWRRGSLERSLLDDVVDWHHLPRDVEVAAAPAPIDRGHPATEPRSRETPAGWRTETGEPRSATSFATARIPVPPPAPRPPCPPLTAAQKTQCVEHKRLERVHGLAPPVPALRQARQGGRATAAPRHTAESFNRMTVPQLQAFIEVRTGRPVTESSKLSLKERALEVVEQPVRPLPAAPDFYEQWDDYEARTMSLEDMQREYKRDQGHDASAEDY